MTAAETRNAAAAFMEAMAADDTHGYDQGSRWGPDYDCSSLVISAYKKAGVPLTCTYTGNMKADMLARGFRDVTGSVALASGSGLIRGDVLLHETHHTAMYMGGGRLVLDDRAAFESEALQNVYKLEGLTEDTALMDEVRAALRRETNAQVTHSSWRNVELMSRGMGKAAALGWLADRLGVLLSDCMAFGDNANDLDMLRAVGWPVAVGNATDGVKRIAKLVADTDAKDGVAKVIFRCLEAQP